MEYARGECKYFSIASKFAMVITISLRGLYAMAFSYEVFSEYPTTSIPKEKIVAVETVIDKYRSQLPLSTIRSVERQVKILKGAYWKNELNIAINSPLSNECKKAHFTSTHDFFSTYSKENLGIAKSYMLSNKLVDIEQTYLCEFVGYYLVMKKLAGIYYSLDYLAPLSKTSERNAANILATYVNYFKTKAGLSNYIKESNIDTSFKDPVTVEKFSDMLNSYLLPLGHKSIPVRSYEEGAVITSLIQQYPVIAWNAKTSTYLIILGVAINDDLTVKGLTYFDGTDSSMKDIMYNDFLSYVVADPNFVYIETKGLDHDW